MDQIISKLSVSNTNLMHRYLINNVCVGLNRALKCGKIIKNREAFNSLKTLSLEANKMPMPILKEVNYRNQLRAYQISLDALEIIEDII